MYIVVAIIIISYYWEAIDQYYTEYTTVSITIENQLWASTGCLAHLVRSSWYMYDFCYECISAQNPHHRDKTARQLSQLSTNLKSSGMSSSHASV